MLATTDGSVITADSISGSRTTLPITLQLQPQDSEWCWAACCAMILSTPTSPVSVEDAAAAVLGTSVTTSDTCDPAVALTRAGLSWEAPPAGVGAPLTPESMQQWVVYGARPVEVYWAYTPDSGHVALVAGYDPDGLPWRVLDPLLGEGWYDYDYLMTYGGRGSWYDSYYNIG